MAVTIPAGFVAVLRDLDAYYGGFGPVDIRLIGHVGQTIWFQHYGTLGNAAYASWRGRQVILAGESFSIAASDASDVTVSGYLLSSP